MLLVDCNGPHACSDVNIYSSVSSTVRCRGRSSACDNINYYCGDMTSVLEGPLFAASTDRSISCKFQHLTAYGTVNSFFGCYGDVKECTSTAITDYAFTDSGMYCDTDNTPCVIDCETSASCMNDVLECTTENSHLCQCKNNENCDSVRIGPPQALIATDDPQMSSTVLDELQAEAKQPANVTTTAAAQKTTDKETVTTTAAATSASNSASTTSTSGSTMQEEPATTKKPSTVTTQTVTEESTKQPSIVTTQTNDKETTEQLSTDTEKPSIGTTETIDEATTEQPSTDTTQTVDEESTTKSSISSTSQPVTTVNIMTTKISPVMNATEQPAADYQEKSTGHVLKAWQLALLIVLPTIAVAIGCFIVVYAIQRWRKGDETIHGRLHDEENPLGIYTPLKKIQIGGQTTIETETTMTEETQHTKCASAQSIDLVLVSPETGALNTTTTTAIEGDGH
jgi:hypothetical protein